jgi:hypothetical protein
MGMDIEPDGQAVNEKIEAYIIDLGLPFEEVQEGLWLIHDDIDFIDNIVVYHNPPVLTFRVKLADAPEGEEQPQLYRRLLELNATSMIAGAYGLEDDAVVIVESLQSDNLRQSEFQAAIDTITLAVREHYHDLKTLIKPKSDDNEREPVEAADRA